MAAISPTTTAHVTTTPTTTPSRKLPGQNDMSSLTSTVFSKSRFEVYNRLQAATVAFGETLLIPEIVALDGKSDDKSYLLEALLGFRFNVREIEMGTRRPLVF